MTKDNQECSSQRISGHRPRLAVLIDAENLSARLADGLFKYIDTLGVASVRHIHGNFSDGCLDGWYDAISRYAIVQHHQNTNIAGKNTSDISLVIDAMDLLHSGLFDGFCIVSSDSDFTSLAKRIREEGLDVYGFGEAKAPQSLRSACREYFDLEHLNLSSSGNFDEICRARRILKKAITKIETPDGWVSLSQIGQKLAGFDYPACGARGLKQLAEQTEAFKFREQDSGGWCIREKHRSSVEASKP